MNKSTAFAIIAFSFMSFFLYQGLYNDPKKVENMGIQSSNMVQKFSWNNVVTDIIENVKKI